MESEDKCAGVPFNKEPEPANIDYENLPPEVEEKMRELMAKDTNMPKAEAYKIATSSSEEEKNI